MKERYQHGCVKDDLSDRLGVSSAAPGPQAGQMPGIPFLLPILSSSVQSQECLFAFLSSLILVEELNLCTKRFAMFWYHLSASISQKQTASSLALLCFSTQMCPLQLSRTISCPACLLLKAGSKQSPVPRESLALKKKWKPSKLERMFGRRSCTKQQFHFSSSLEALKGKFIFYLDILVISNLLVSKQLSLPTTEVLMKAMDSVFFPPLKSNITDTG